jgi:hypothetical protein
MTKHASTTSDKAFPKEFDDLEHLSGWALATERERNYKRRTSHMSEVQSVYDTVLPRMDAIIEYLNQFQLDNMPPDAERLLHLTLSLAEVAPAVEFYKQPEVVDGFPAERFIPVEVPHMTPKE